MKAVLILALSSVLLVSCASGSRPTAADPSSISDTPDRFLVLDVATGTRSEPSGPACRSPLVDPRDGTRLILVRSSSGFGDYRPETPRYGLADNQLLRIDCDSGGPVGATPDAL
jgi:hypothetical protein